MVIFRSYVSLLEGNYTTFYSSQFLVDPICRGEVSTRHSTARHGPLGLQKVPTDGASFYHRSLFFLKYFFGTIFSQMGCKHQKKESDIYIPHPLPVRNPTFHWFAPRFESSPTNNSLLETWKEWLYPARNRDVR